MNISKEGFDSKLLRWSGFALAGFIVAAMALGAPSRAPAAGDQVSASDTTGVRLGQLPVPVCTDRC